MISQRAKTPRRDHLRVHMLESLDNRKKTPDCLRRARPLNYRVTWAAIQPPTSVRVLNASTEMTPNRRGVWLLCLLLLAAVTFSLTSDAADGEPPKKTLFLPKSATAAAYVLARLSNKELLAAPRSEFVYVALLQRAGLERKFRIEALEGLAKTRNTDALTELIGGIAELDKKGDEVAPVLRDLAALLLQNKAADLAAKRAGLEKLASESQLPLGRQIGYAALVTADASVDKAWQQVDSDAAKLADLLLSIPLIRDMNLRATVYPKVEPLVHKSDPVEVRRAAITALAAVPGHDTEIFNTLAALLKSGT